MLGHVSREINNGFDLHRLFIIRKRNEGWFIAKKIDIPHEFENFSGSFTFLDRDPNKIFMFSDSQIVLLDFTTDAIEVL